MHTYARLSIKDIFVLFEIKLVFYTNRASVPPIKVVIYRWFKIRNKDTFLLFDIQGNVPRETNPI